MSLMNRSFKMSNDVYCGHAGPGLHRPMRTYSTYQNDSTRTGLLWSARWLLRPWRYWRGGSLISSITLDSQLS